MKISIERSYSDHYRPPRRIPAKAWWWIARIVSMAGGAVLVYLQLRDLLDQVLHPMYGIALNPVLTVLTILDGAVIAISTLCMPTNQLTGATTHGSAGWAEDEDILPLLRDARAPLPSGGLLLAPRNRRTNLVLPRQYADYHVMLLGPSGSGKTFDYLLPWMGMAQTSVVATDPKGELWKHTSGYHREAWRFAPREPNASRAFNWIPLCRDEHIARLLALALMQPAEDIQEQHFWKFADLRMCAALFAHAAHQAVPTPTTVYRLLLLSPTQLIDLLRTSPSMPARAFANTLAEMKSETQAGVVLSVANKLSFMDDPVVRRFTSASLIPPNFGRLVDDPDRPVAVYWVVHERDASLLQPLTAIFLTLLMEHLGRVPAHPEARAALFLDEFANIGRIPDFPTTQTVARGRNMQLILGVQSLSQLDALYGHAGAKTIRTNCATKIVLHGLDEVSGEEVSRALGETTVQHEVQTRTPEGWTNNTYSYAEQHIQRRLLTSDEVRRIGIDQAIIIVSNLRPILAKRFKWNEPPREADTDALGPEQGMDPPSGLPDVPSKPRPPIGPSADFRRLQHDVRNLDDHPRDGRRPDARR